MSDSLSFTILYETGDDGWIVARIKEVPGALSQGKTKEEARENVIDALRLMLAPEANDVEADSEPLQISIAP